jgi:hypothetical protein
MELGVVAMARVMGEERGFKLVTDSVGRTCKGTTMSRSRWMVGVMMTTTRAGDRGGLKLCLTQNGDSTCKGTSTRRGSEMEWGVVATARVLGKEIGSRLLTRNGDRTRKETTMNRSKIPTWIREGSNQGG